MLTWHIITGEYPPVIGGVSGYSRLVARGLAGAGDEVHVWCPSLPAAAPADAGVAVHPELGRLSRRDLHAAARQLDRFPSPRRLLVQWVPHAFGYRSLNIAFCRWLLQRARRGDAIEIMVHEPYLAFGEGAIRWTAAAVIHRLMTMILARAASRVWVAIPEWERRWRPYALGRDLPFTWLPIPNSLPIPAPDDVRRVRARHALRGGLIVGHLGSYGVETSRALAAILPGILRQRPSVSVLLLGRNGPGLERRMASEHPDIAARVHSPGTLEADALASHVAACDLLVQPYPDGVSSRRTSAMAGLAFGVAMVTTSGHLTERLWSESGGVVLSDANDADALGAATLRLLADDGERARRAARGREVYAARFDVSRTIDTLRRDALSGHSAELAIAERPFTSRRYSE